MHAVMVPARPAFPTAAPGGDGGGALRLADVLGALSHALDLGAGQAGGHGLRCGWIGMHVGYELGLAAPALSDLYYTLLLKDAGASGNAARLWEAVGGERHPAPGRDPPRIVLAPGPVQLGLSALRGGGDGCAALGARIARALALARDGAALSAELVRTRSERGAEMVRRFGFSEAVAAGVAAADEHWNGRGRPDGLRGRRIPLGARIALLARVVDAAHGAGGPDGALAEARRRAGTWLDPRLVEAFVGAGRAGGFWDALADPALGVRVALLEPRAHLLRADEDRLDEVAAAFADVIDARSGYAAGHSRRVTAYGDAIAERLGLPPAARRALRRAGLLHDIGRLGVGVGILHRPGTLDGDGWDAVRRYPALTEEILGRAGGFRDLAPLAAAHRERLDGRGYPKGLSASAIGRETRILTAADIFDALTQDRPQRGAYGVADALAIMRADVGTALDPEVFAALEAAAPGLAFGA